MFDRYYCIKLFCLLWHFNAEKWVLCWYAICITQNITFKKGAFIIIIIVIIIIIIFIIIILDSKMDGKNQWPTISQGKPSARKEFVYNIDEIQNNSAIR